MSPENAILTYDLGTGSARAALVTFGGDVRCIRSNAIHTFSPRHGYSEQKPQDWWAAVIDTISQMVDFAGKNDLRITAVIGCGHMHAPVLIDRNGELVRERVPLWNDKRAQAHAERVAEREDYPELTAISANPAASSWPGIKLLWTAQHDPEALERAQWVLMPKDFINFRLAGVAAQDRTEAGSSFVYDTTTESWSPKLRQALGLPDIFPDLRAPTDRLGVVGAKTSTLTGLPEGIPVFTGGGDYPISVLGSGAYKPGQLSDITGTSSLLSRLSKSPIMHPEIMNAANPDTLWMSFCVVDAAGDAIRWGRSKLEEDQVGFEHIEELAHGIAPGSNGLIFLPYLTGERLGYGHSSRAAFIGLTAAHGKPEMHRAIQEGTAMGLWSAAQPMLDTKTGSDVVIAAGGGARSKSLLKIKASVFGIPFQPVNEVECGIMGSALVALTGLGVYADLPDAVGTQIKHAPPVLPDPALSDFYADMAQTFQRLRHALAPEWASLTRADLRNPG